ncbi:hypothetical protein [Ferruginibacter sp. SUN106]|uniref:hypothetical protein n=1 Tax=Ferruginibacter sp. SUN106 TaxID=2978348 RepID=UPI003D368FA3
MKRIIFILLFSVGAVSMVQAQVLKILKTKAKTAVDNSVDRSTSKVVDKTINSPADNVTDTVLNKAGKKLQSFFKRKDKKNNAASDTARSKVPPLTDTVAIKPPGQN